MAISKRLRFEILRRDGFKRRYCHASEALLTIDHVTPVTLGGSDHPTNLVASCDECNSGKTSVLPGGATVVDADEDDVRWARAIKKAAARARGRRDGMDRYRSAFRAEWDRWHYGENQTRFPLPATWGTLLDQFYEADLPASMWREIVELAMAKNAARDRFEYACSLGWKKIAELRHAARGLAEGADSIAGADGDELVIDAAVHVWRSFWMPEHQAEPPPDIEAQFRADASAHHDEYGADDLMRIARTCAEEGIDDLIEALEYARIQEEEPDEAHWNRDKFFDTWIGQWRASAPEWPLPCLDDQDLFQAHVAAACEAGYDGTSIDYAAYKAGNDHTPLLADHLESAHDVLRSRAEWKARRAALSASATRLWLDSYAQSTGGDQPVKADTEKFTEHVAGKVGRHCEEYILQAAQHAGTELDYTIDRYLPAETEVPF